MTTEQRKKLASDLEHEIGDLLRAKGVLLDGYMCREVEATASKLAYDAVMKKKELAETR